MVFNATFNNISAISWRSALLVEEQPTYHKLLTGLTNNCNLIHDVFIGQLLLGLNSILSLKYSSIEKKTPYTCLFDIFILLMLRHVENELTNTFLTTFFLRFQSQVRNDKIGVRWTTGLLCLSRINDLSVPSKYPHTSERLHKKCLKPYRKHTYLILPNNRSYVSQLNNRRKYKNLFVKHIK